MGLFVALVFPLIACFLSCFGFLYFFYGPKGPSVISLALFGLCMFSSLFLFVGVL